MAEAGFLIGLDCGSESPLGVLVDAATAALVAEAVHPARRNDQQPAERLAFAARLGAAGRGRRRLIEAASEPSFCAGSHAHHHRARKMMETLPDGARREDLSTTSVYFRLPAVIASTIRSLRTM
jgi:ribulose kinase